MNRLVPDDRRPLRGTGILVTTRSHRPRASARLQALRCAAEGLRDTWGTQPNLRLHGLFATVVIGLGIWCHLRTTQWLWVSFAIGLVVFAELMNTAIEHLVDLVVGLRPDPLARRIKDVAAASVLVASLTATTIGLLIFLPRLVRS